MQSHNTGGNEQPRLLHKRKPVTRAGGGIVRLAVVDRAGGTCMAVMFFVGAMPSS